MVKSENLQLAMCMPCGDGARGGRVHTYIRHLANRDLLPGRLRGHCSCSKWLMRAHLDMARPHPNLEAKACRRAERRNLRSIPTMGVNRGLGRSQSSPYARMSQHGQVSGRRVQPRVRAGEWAGLHLSSASLRPSGGAPPTRCACRRYRPLDGSLTHQLLSCTSLRP